MSRDPNRLKVFQIADELVVDVYKATRDFPPAERFGLQSQIRRAAVSVPANIVEGCARQSLRDYVRFLNVALASASEARYLVDLARRLGLVADEDAEALLSRLNDIVRMLQSMTRSLETFPDS